MSERRGEEHVPEERHREVLYYCSDPYGRKLEHRSSTQDHVEEDVKQ